MIQILLVEDHPALRIGLRATMEGLNGIQIMGDAANGQEAVNMLKQHVYDLALMDINMPVMNGIEATIIIKKTYSRTKVLIYSSIEEEHTVMTAIRAGVDGYLFKSDDRTELMNAIAMVMKGENYLSERISKNLVPMLFRLWRNLHSAEEVAEELTSREKEVLYLILEGRTIGEIGAKLMLSNMMVERQRYNLMKKTGCKNLAAFFRCAVEKNLV